jgi:hypothetical protein
MCSNLSASEQTTKEHSERVEALHTIVAHSRRNCTPIAAVQASVDVCVLPNKFS